MPSKVVSRIRLTITQVSQNYKPATVAGTDKVVFVRKTSMRAGATAWQNLTVGDTCTAVFKEAAGRAILSDVLKEEVKEEGAAAAAAAAVAAAEDT
eukprot:gene9792-6461_t